MFYVIDLSKPRKYIQWKARAKYDDIALELKLNPIKINKALIVAAAVGVVLVAGSSVNASGAIDQAQYNYLLDHYINVRKYPEELAAKLINKLTVTDFQELYARVEHHDIFMNNGGNQLLDIGNKIGGKLIGGIKFFLTLYDGM
jgi:hypothetical protein